MTNLKKPIAALQEAMSNVEFEMTENGFFYAHVTTNGGKNALVCLGPFGESVSSSASVDLGSKSIAGKNWTKSRINSMLESIEYLAA